MYKNHFGLKVLPFENTPNPEFFFMGSRYRDTLALMIHGILSRKGLICITGPVGSGKTTLANILVRHLPEKNILIQILYPMIKPEELMTAIARHLNIQSFSQSMLLCIEDIQKELVKINCENRHCVLIIDEAHLISDELFREILVLSNLETGQYKLLQILLLGQKELADRLNTEKMRQLKQRAAVNVSLAPMQKHEVFQYIQHRLNTAKGKIETFSSEALELIAHLSEGIPRIVNRLCDTALMEAFMQNKNSVDTADIQKAGNDLGIAPVLTLPLKKVFPEYMMEKHNDDYVQSKTRNKKPGKIIKVFAAGCICMLIVFMFSNIAFKKKDIPLKKHSPHIKKENAKDSNQKEITETSFPSPEKEPVIAPEKHTAPKDIIDSPENSNTQESVPIAIPKITEEKQIELVKYPYSIMLASSQNLKNTKKAIDSFRKKGFFPFWVRFDMGKKGVWFGIYTGLFRNITEAESKIQEHGLKDALIKNTRYAVQVGDNLTKQNLQKETFLLSKHDCSFYTVNTLEPYRLYVGAFLTQEGADQQKKELVSMGIKCQIVER